MHRMISANSMIANYFTLNPRAYLKSDYFPNNMSDFSDHIPQLLANEPLISVVTVKSDYSSYTAQLNISLFIHGLM